MARRHRNRRPKEKKEAAVETASPSRPQPVKKKGSKLPLIIGVAVLVVIVYLVIPKQSTPGQYDQFAQCLVDSGAKIYTAWWCPHCQEQEKMFGNSWKILDNGGVNIECSPDGSKSFSAFCTNTDGFHGTPMWKLADGTILQGVQSLPGLASATGCTLEPPAQ